MYCSKHTFQLLGQTTFQWQITILPKQSGWRWASVNQVGSFTDSNNKLCTIRLQSGPGHRADLWRLSEQSASEVNHLVQHSHKANGKQTHNLSRVCLCAPTLLSCSSFSNPSIYPHSGWDSKPDTDALQSISALRALSDSAPLLPSHFPPLSSSSRQFLLLSQPLADSFFCMFHSYMLYIHSPKHLGSNETSSNDILEKNKNILYKYAFTLLVDL